LQLDNLKFKQTVDAGGWINLESIGSIEYLSASGERPGWKHQGLSSMLQVYPRERTSSPDPVVITGIGIVSSLGLDRESTWAAVRRGESGVRRVENYPDIPSHLGIAAVADCSPHLPKQLKVVHLAHRAAEEAMRDANLGQHANADATRFACAISGHMGDWRWLRQHHDKEGPDAPGDASKWNQWLPNSSCWSVARRFNLNGPRICHSTACASGLIDIMSAVRAIHDDQCDLALAGSAEAIDPLFAAGFQKMRVLAEADDPRQACRPFDRRRTGFVMGEGAAMFVIERLSHALARNARIYAEIAGGKMMADAHHVTGLDMQSESLTRLIRETLQRAGMEPADIGYVSAHGTATPQNDVMETRGIRRAFGRHADDTCVSALKSMLGHLVNASGSVELALTTLALRDGFVPPTLNLTDQDPECDLDCIPLVGQQRKIQNALKLALAFGGHLVAVALKRWNETETGFGDPHRRAA
jgi:3-oxoacyl-(acyl-carrier-protein) synthase